MITKREVMPLLLKACPSFKLVWERWTNDEEYMPSVYLDMNVFAKHIVDLYMNGNTQEFPDIFNTIEHLHIEGNDYVKEAATVGLLEDIQGELSDKKIDLAVFLPFLGHVSREYWDKVIKFWETGEIIK